MTVAAIRRSMVTCVAALGLAACGGGGGGGSGFASTPTPPTPPPTSLTAPVNIFPLVTSSTSYAALGYERGTGALIGSGFSVTFDAATGAYVFDLPAHNPAAFRVSTSVPQNNNAYWIGGLIDPTVSTGLWPPMSVLKASPDNPLIQLSYTSFGQYYQAGPMEDRPHGIVAFGVATPAAAVPTSGTATMNAILGGQVNQDSPATIGGTAIFQFDFGAGTLSGSMSPILYPYYANESFALGQYDFVSTIYSVGSPTFSGGLKHATNGLTGSFSGQFTGPQAQELMARWVAQFADPTAGGAPTEMFGVAVGRRP